MQRQLIQSNVLVITETPDMQGVSGSKNILLHEASMFILFIYLFLQKKKQSFNSPSTKQGAGDR